MKILLKNTKTIDLLERADWCEVSRKKPRLRIHALFTSDYEMRTSGSNALYFEIRVLW